MKGSLSIFHCLFIPPSHYGILKGLFCVCVLSVCLTVSQHNSETADQIRFKFYIRRGMSMAESTSKMIWIWIRVQISSRSEMILLPLWDKATGLQSLIALVENEFLPHPCHYPQISSFLQFPVPPLFPLSSPFLVLIQNESFHYLISSFLLFFSD